MDNWINRILRWYLLYKTRYLRKDIRDGKTRKKTWTDAGWF